MLRRAEFRFWSGLDTLIMTYQYCITSLFVYSWCKAPRSDSRASRKMRRLVLMGCSLLSCDSLGWCEMDSFGGRGSAILQTVIVAPSCEYFIPMRKLRKSVKRCLFEFRPRLLDMEVRRGNKLY